MTLVKQKVKVVNLAGAARTLASFRRHPVLFCLLAIGLVFLALPATAPGQDDPLDAAPPPLKLMSREERSRLGAQTELKERTKLALDLMNTRLLAAEKLNVSKDFGGMFRELGAFNALMDDALEHLLKGNRSAGKVLDNLKRLEIGLRLFSPRIEAIRREVPLSYDEYVGKLLKYIREARTRASEPLFADTVVPVKSGD